MERRADVRFFHVHVVPNFRRYEADPLSESAAMSLAVVQNQMADHFWHANWQAAEGEVYKTRTPGAYRKVLASREPIWALMRDIAESHKHVLLDREGRRLTSCDQVGKGAMPYGKGGWGEGPWGGGPSLIVQLDDSSVRHFSTIAQDVQAMWERMLSSVVRGYL